MTTFDDGPAKGQVLQLQRAPVLLRVVEAKGKWDALDQLDDVPSADETIHVYLLTSVPGRGHMYFGGGRGAFFMIASYRFYMPQPADDVARDTAKWREWANGQPLEPRHLTSNSAPRRRTGLGEARREAV